MPYLLAHDLGTSGNKATLYSHDGRLIASRTHHYGLSVDHGNRAEQNADDWWDSVCRTSRELAALVDPSEIAAVSFSGQMMGCLCVDSNGTPLRPSIIWADMRSEQQEQAVRSRIDEHEFLAITGHRISPSYGGFKLRWIKDNEPEIYAKTHCVLNAKDYMLYKLTGRFATDYSDAGASCLFDIRTNTWSKRLLDIFELDESKMPEALPSTAVVGPLTAEAAAQTGLKEGTPIIAGGGDGPCAAVGSGCVREGIANSCMGTSSWISTASSVPVTDATMTTVNFGHVIPGFVMPCGTIQCGGGSLNWIVSQLCGEWRIQAEAEGKDVYELVADAVRNSPIGAKGLLFLPHLIGERSPHWDPLARGAFIGLTMEHTLSDLVRAVMEGVAMTLDMVLTAFNTHLSIEALHVIGGGAQSDEWMQIFADVYGIPVKRTDTSEQACSMGAAITAGVGAGLFDSFDVVERFVHVTDSFEPNGTSVARYAQLKKLYLRAFPALQELFHDLSAFQQNG